MLRSRKIGTKILVLICTLLLSSVGLYLYLATNTFLKDKIGFVFDLNKTTVSNLASQLETNLLGTVDKLKLFSVVSLSESKNQKLALKQIIDEDPLLISVNVYELQENNFVLKDEFYQNKFSESYNLEPGFFSKILPQQKTVPFDLIQKDQVAVWNASAQNNPVLIGLGTKILAEKKNSKNKTPLTIVIVGYLKADLFLKAITQAGTSDMFVLDSLGKILIHPDPNYLYKNYNYAALPIVQDFKQNQSILTVKKYTYQNIEFLGAYARTQSFNLGVFSTTQADDAFDAVKVLMKRSFIFGLIVFFLSIIIASFFAMTLTNPIRRLVAATDEIAQGNLNTVVEIDTQDEIKILADSFNKMTGDLKKSRLELEKTNQELEEVNKGLENKVKERTRQLEELATKDPLTGAYNRRFFNERLKSELSRIERAKSALGLIYLDIDHFKKYNDTNGHPGGDILLKHFTEILRLSIRKSDVLARIGGEEFCIILPDTDLEGARVVAEKVRLSVEKTPFPNGDKQPLGRVTCSLGVSEFPTLSNNDEGLIKCADEALYIIKQKSRNAVGTGLPQENYQPLYTPVMPKSEERVPEEKKAG